ncbi:hypothetical protein CEXT_693711 [Caerostris extrusa]|uniref:Uncharacterized protein n=1 Tax=Caerostris extrusa TaxID=172846 RepID=A0AAV4Y2E5_CAEEX|nr:hypothetical protein CEXT_693711 [Caerostris extrusa]
MTTIRAVSHRARVNRRRDVFMAGKWNRTKGKRNHLRINPLKITPYPRLIEVSRSEVKRAGCGSKIDVPSGGNVNGTPQLNSRTGSAPSSTASCNPSMTVYTPVTPPTTTGRPKCLTIGRQELPMART